MSTIHDQYFGAADETVFSTGVAATRFYEFVSEGVEGKYERVNSEGVRAGTKVLRSDRFATSAKGAEGDLSIESLDAPVVALGEKMPVHFSRNQPDLAKGFHFSLFNNGWGTNYVQWFGEDMRFRFRLSA